MATDNWEDDGSVVIFGGIRYNAAVTVRTFFSDIWSYDPSVNTWTLIPQNNAGPGPRMGAGIAIDGDTMYMFGGIDPTFQSHNDLWKFDLMTGLWTLITPDNTNPALPDDRYIFTFEINRPRADSIYLHGGNFSPAGSGEQRQDSWEYNIQTNTWTDITGDFPARIHNAAGARNKEFYLAFGDVNDDTQECRTNQASGGQNPVNEVWRYTANKDTWEQLTVLGGPGELKRVASTVVGNTLYVWGGYDFVCGEDHLGGFAVYQRDLYSLKL
jgi:N-acetylneuraminic acid mutarotase